MQCAMGTLYDKIEKDQASPSMYISLVLSQMQDLKMSKLPFFPGPYCGDCTMQESLNRSSGLNDWKFTDSVPANLNPSNDLSD